MADSKKSTAPKAPAPQPEPKSDEKHNPFGDALEKGYFGSVPDPTPNENYSLQTPQDAPTPETDDKLRAEADKNVRGR